MTKSLVEKVNCAACGACLNICPKQAITMQEDEYGFWYPIIDSEKCTNCNLCKKTCAKISEIQKNKYIKSLALQSKDTDLIQKSSSGGMFAQLAKYILSQNGVVFGCEMVKLEDSFDVKHIYIEDEKDLYKLQGSKYVQSDIGYSYKQAKEFLSQNKLVLFSGTPCQIAGLKAYLNKDYDNLLCVDLSCEGVPNQKFFNDYVKFVEKHILKNKIIDFKFRDKQIFNWGTTGFVAYYKQNNQLKSKKLYQTTSSYFDRFIEGGIHRDSCYNCKLVGLERVSDITIADCWGIKQNYKELLKNNGGKLNPKAGISLVLINTAKGEGFLERIKDNLIIEKINIEKVKEFNGPLRRPVIINDSKRKYLEIYKNQGYFAMDKEFQKKISFKKRLFFAIKNKLPEFVKDIIRARIKSKNTPTDCLLMTWYMWKNYGSILTAYALYKSIKNMGYSTKIIDNHPPISYGADFNKKNVETTEFCINNKDFSNLNKISSTFIVGADNQLNYGDLGNVVYRNLLDFADADSKKMIVSGSFGNWNWNETPEIMQNLKNLYERFDFISTRENISTGKFKEIFDINAKWFMEPVFFLAREEYEKLIINSKTKNYNNSIMSYILYPNKEADKTIEYLKNTYDYEVNYFFGNNLTPEKEKDKSKSVENWLKAIRDSEYVVTDSFHCVCFAILFNKPVICLKNNCDISRFKSQFEKFKINIPLFNTFEEYKNSQMYEIKWDIVNNLIENEREIILKIIKEEIKKAVYKTKKQINAEKEFQKLKTMYFSKHDKFYMKNKIVYSKIVYPLITPIYKFIRSKYVQR